MLENPIAKRVSLVSFNLFGGEVDDSFATLTLHENLFRIEAVGQIEDVPYKCINCVEKKWWWYKITWEDNGALIEIKVSAFKLNSFITELKHKTNS